MDQELTSQLLTQMAELQASIDQSRPVWIFIVPPIITAVVGFFAAWAPTAWSERKRVMHETRTLRFSLIAEISAMAEIIRARRYLEALREGAAGKRSALSVNVPSDYFIVYKSNTARLGLLEPMEAARIVYLYHLVESVVQDVTLGGVLSTGEGGQQAFQQDIDFLEHALVLADELVTKHTANS